MLIARWLPMCSMGLMLILPEVGVGQGKKDPKTGEINTPAAKGERKTTALRPGDPAPDFTLPDLKKTKEVKLSSFQGKKPVVLIFGSYT
jgi:hypothetical protein